MLGFFICDLISHNKKEKAYENVMLLMLLLTQKINFDSLKEVYFAKSEPTTKITQ